MRASYLAVLSIVSRAGCIASRAFPETLAALVADKSRGGDYAVDSPWLQGVFMSFRSLIAAAAVVVGIGQAAEAATYDVIFTITSAEHTYSPWDDSEYTVTPLSEWWGMAVNAPLRGVLEVADDILPVLTVGGLTLFGETGYGSQISPGSWLEPNTGYLYNYLTWNGSEGTWTHLEDLQPDYYDIAADIRLAPVPLPAPAALLPMGVGALAFLRKRRHQVS